MSGDNSLAFLSELPTEAVWEVAATDCQDFYLVGRMSQMLLNK